jgi:CRP-like cAMP-binding protein
MEVTYSLKNFIKQQFNSNEKLPFSITRLKVKKNYSLIKYGDIESKIHYIRSGIIESTTLDLNDEEIIIAFNFPNQITCSLSSIITKEPTVFNMKCITDCELDVIDLNELREALNNNSKIANELMRYILEYYYLVRLKKQADFLSKDSLSRYNDLLKQEPEIVKKIPVNKIAKYIGIHPKTLSKLRRLI